MEGKVKIVKCSCGDLVCNKYGLSDGTFFQGTGWSKELAQRHAAAFNADSAFKAMKNALERFRREGHASTCECSVCAQADAALKLADETPKAGE